MPSNKVIIDTDPGCDDVLALLLALASNPADVEIELISVTFGNISVKGCLQNVVSTFHVIEKERQWRRGRGLPEGFEMLAKSKPLVAVGADGPLGGQKMQADYYHGIDGLGGVQSSHPHHTLPEDTWGRLFEPPPPEAPTDDPITTAAASATHDQPPYHDHSFTPSTKHAVDEILSILSANPPDTVTLIAIGPLTNFALAAAKAPQTFIRAKCVAVMGGAIDESGNISPVGEFNCIADPTAAARVYALTSPNPQSTMPPSSVEGPNALGPYPPKEELAKRRLNVIMFPLDVTTPHLLRKADMDAMAKPLIAEGSPMAEWVSAFTSSTFERNASLYVNEGAFMALHDPVVVWYAISAADQGWKIDKDLDVRVETAGQWTKGMCVVDRRGRKRVEEAKDHGGEVDGDLGGWLSRFKGNRVGRCVGTPGYGVCSEVLLNSIFAAR